MKCGNCKLWNWRIQGETIRDLKRQYKQFGKAIGLCTCKFGANYPMFNYEKCPFQRKHATKISKGSNMKMKRVTYKS